MTNVDLECSIKVDVGYSVTGFLLANVSDFTFLSLQRNMKDTHSTAVLIAGFSLRKEDAICLLSTSDKSYQHLVAFSKS